MLYASGLEKTKIKQARKMGYSQVDDLCVLCLALLYDVIFIQKLLQGDILRGGGTGSKVSAAEVGAHTSRVA